MSLTPISRIIADVEPVLWLTVLLVFLRSRSRTSFSAFGIFLAICTAGTLFLLGIRYAQPFAISKNILFFYGYWVTCLAGYITLFFVIRQLFRQIAAPFPHLGRIGAIAFQWAAVVSLLISAVSFFTVTEAMPTRGRMAMIFPEIDCSFSLLLLCLLALVAVSLRSVRFSFRSRITGICLGLFVLTITSLTSSAIQILSRSILPQLLSGIGTCTALLVWIVYMFLPEAAVQQAAQPVPANVLPWNDLAQELGPSEQPQPSEAQGFLQNVESVVDRVLAKNSLG